jgi:transcriptional antiterminator NusG
MTNPDTTTDQPDAPAADEPKMADDALAAPDAAAESAATLEAPAADEPKMADAALAAPDAAAESAATLEAPEPTAFAAPERPMRDIDDDAAAAVASLFGDLPATSTDAPADGVLGAGTDGAGVAISAAEREYQEAMRASEALGLDKAGPVAAIDAEAESAERLAEKFGLGDSKAPEPEDPAPNVAEELARAETDEILGPETTDGRAWYVLNTYSGHENKVDENLKRRVESMDVADRIFDIVVPTEEELEIRGGQRRQVQRKLLPGYVLVNMILDDDTWYVVRNTPGVTGFVGAEKPHALPREEVAAILKQTRVAEPRVRVGFEIGDLVRVMEGPFQDFTGEVDEINIEKGKVRVLISMFGRDTPVELDFMQVEKV